MTGPVPAEMWRLEAACQGHTADEFFPTTQEGVLAAIDICQRCPVRTICLDYALTNNIGYGVWGGCSDRKRRRIRSNLKKAA